MGRKGKQQTGIGEAEVTAWMRHSLGFTEEMIQQVLDMPLDRYRLGRAWELLTCLWSREARYRNRRVNAAELQRWVASHPGMVPRGNQDDEDTEVRD
jgi:hypothetical protein